MINHSRGIKKAVLLLIGIGFVLPACAADFAPTYPDSWLHFEDTASCINEEHCHLEPSILLASFPARQHRQSHCVDKRRLA